MTFLSRLKATLPLLFYWLVVTLRALPAYERNTYATECGEWLGRMWQTSFSAMIFGARGDYPVLGNMVIIKVSDMLTQLIGGHSLAACGPFIQHTVACLYVALIFWFAWTVLRRHHGVWPAFLICTLMLLVPDLDDENRIFGEANNAGFFSAIVALVIGYDLWLQPLVSLRRAVGYSALLGFHLLTSPMAGLVIAGFAALLLARLVLNAKREPLDKAARLRLAALCGFALALAAFTILRAKPENADPNSEAAAHTAAVVMPRFWEHFIELVFCRQLLYPLTFGLYRVFSNGLTLVLLGAVLAATGAWLWAERKHLRTDWPRITGMALIPVIAFCMAAVTLWSRGWLTQMEQPYTKVWPSRYYLVQTMVSAAFFAMLALRAGDLMPRFKRESVAFVIALGLAFAWAQSEPVNFALNHHDPAVRAKEWQAQLGRTAAIRSLTDGGTLAGGDRERVEVEMYIDYHFVPVPAPLVRDFVTKQKQVTKDLCQIATTETATMKSDDSHNVSPLKVSGLRCIPRPKGTLVTCDIALDDRAHFDIKRRELWLGSIPGSPQLLAWAYMEKQPRYLEASRKRLSDLERWLFKVAIWFDKPQSPAAIRQALSGLPVVLGPVPGEYIARGTLLPEGHELPCSALDDDDVLALRTQPLKPAFTWQWKSKELKPHNVSLAKGSVEITEDPSFDEAAYLRLNPDVDQALKSKLITSAQGHWETWGHKEGRPAATASVTLALPGGKLTSDQLAGLSVAISKRKHSPAMLRCVLHGATPDQQAAITLAPTEGQGVFECHYLTPESLGTTFPAQTLEVQFESPQPNREFRIESLTLYQR